MSRGFESKSTEVLGELVRELRQCYGLGASFFRAAAARIEMTDSDMQVLDILENSGEASAGQIANLMGLTTGTCTGILNRLEQAGLIRRERDPSDGRRVIVRLATGADGKHDIGPLFASIGKAWEDMAAQYDDEQKAFLLEFLQRSNALTRQEIDRLREESAGNENIFSAPLAEVKSARLVFPTGAFRLTLRAGDVKDALYQARFEGPVPDVKVQDGVVTIRYPRRLWVPGKEKRAAQITLNFAIPWQIVIQGGLYEAQADLRNLNLISLEVKGGLSTSRLELPVPAGVVPIRISGGASEITLHRPAGVAARVSLKGWAAELVFDQQTFKAVGNDVQLQSPGFDPTAPHYNFEVLNSVSQITITSG